MDIQLSSEIAIRLYHIILYYISGQWTIRFADMLVDEDRTKDYHNLFQGQSGKSERVIDDFSKENKGCIERRLKETHLFITSLKDESEWKRA